jgi:hypothetical protein
MSKQNPRDQVAKAAWNLFEGVKDTIQANLTAASSSGQLDVKGETLARLLLIVNASIEEGYHRGSRVFGKAVDQAVAVAVAPPLAARLTKKSGG